MVDMQNVHYYAFLVNKIPVGVFGASGYAGRELCRFVATHPNMDLVFATANEQRGSSLNLPGKDIVMVANEDAPMDSCDVVFSALPHGASKSWVEQAQTFGARVVDLSSDLRPGNGCDGVPYGLTELNRPNIVGASVVANPGCYPTSVLLALGPLVQQNLIVPHSTIVVNSASGVTGAGNSPKRELLFAEVAQDFRAYGLGNTHRHLPEMRATLSAWQSDAQLVFTPHLLPVTRGILSTIIVPVSAPLADPLAPWRHAYAAEPFIEVTPETPSLRGVVHRNVARLSAVMLAGMSQPTLLVTCAIDNLVKGAAGQAIQNANVMLGLVETAGLPA
jgi:N-acetyl-gamma-glutamyl-phosphate reductase